MFPDFAMWPFMALGIALQGGFWLLLIGGIVWAVRQRQRHRTPSDLGARAMPRPRDALEILRERYARGEIDTAEFDEMVSRLVRRDAPGYPPPPNDPRVV